MSFIEYTVYEYFVCSGGVESGSEGRLSGQEKEEVQYVVVWAWVYTGQEQVKASEGILKSRP